METLWYTRLFFIVWLDYNKTQGQAKSSSHLDGSRLARQRCSWCSRIEVGSEAEAEQRRRRWGAGWAAGAERRRRRREARVVEVEAIWGYGRPRLWKEVVPYSMFAISLLKRGIARSGLNGNNHMRRAFFLKSCIYSNGNVRRGNSLIITLGSFWVSQRKWINDSWSEGADEQTSLLPFFKKKIHMATHAHLWDQMAWILAWVMAQILQRKRYGVLKVVKKEPACRTCGHEGIENGRFPRCLRFLKISLEKIEKPSKFIWMQWESYCWQITHG